MLPLRLPGAGAYAGEPGVPLSSVPRPELRGTRGTGSGWTPMPARGRRHTQWIASTGHFVPAAWMSLGQRPARGSICESVELVPVRPCLPRGGLRRPDHLAGLTGARRTCMTRWRRYGLCVALCGSMVGSVLAQQSLAKPCGVGPHDITMLVPVPCDCKAELTPLPDGRYRAVQLCPPPDIRCQREQHAKWTDWPECPGAAPVPAQLSSEPMTTP